MTEPSPTVLIVETSADEECPVEFLGDSAELVYFLSFAHAERYGADHPLAKASAIMKHRLGLKLGPLLKFGDARPDDPGEGQLLESLWQEAQPLADSARQAAEALESTPELRELTGGFPELPERLRELASMAAWAAERGAEVRLTYAI